MARRFHPHVGNDCPVPADTVVEYLLSDDGLNVQRGRAGDVYWGPGLGPDGEGRVTHYGVRTDEFERAVHAFISGAHTPVAPDPGLLVSPEQLERAVDAYNASSPAGAQITYYRARKLLALVRAQVQAK